MVVFSVNRLSSISIESHRMHYYMGPLENYVEHSTRDDFSENSRNQSYALPTLHSNAPTDI